MVEINEVFLSRYFEVYSSNTLKEYSFEFIMIFKELSVEVIQRNSINMYSIFNS